VVDTATRLGLVGWVRNADDERAVELVAEGEPAPLDALQSQLPDGPGAAWVDRVEASRGPASGGMTRFEIRR
jgi:acylphosphatase